MTASRLPPEGILVIEDNEVLDLSMTLIVGMKTYDSLIVASDSLAGWNTQGREHLPLEKITDFEKIRTVAPTVVYGVSGNKVNNNLRLQNNIANHLRKYPEETLEDLATVIANHIPELYSDRINDPEFSIYIFLAGYSSTKNKPEMYFIHKNQVRAWGDDHPWMTVGTENDRSDTYIKTRYEGKLKSKSKTIALLKGAIADTAKHNPSEVGGPPFIYEVTKKGVTRLE